MAKTKNISLNDDKVLAIVKKILQATTSSDFAYYEDFQIRSYTDDNKKVRMTMAVIVPEEQRSNAKIFLTKKIRSYKYPVGNAGQSGVSIVVNPHPKKETRQLDVVVSVLPESEEANQVIRIVVKPSKSGGSRGGSKGARITESAQALYCALRFNVYDSDILLPSDDQNSIINITDFQTAWESCECDATFEEVLSVEGDWQKSCILGANRLFRTFRTPAKNLYRFYRGAGVDALINAAYLKVKNEEPLETVPGSEDKWNPADIWIAKNNFDSSEIPKAATKGLVLNLNQFLEEQFNTTPYQTLAGVSLKKIKGSATVAEVNTNTVNQRSEGIKFDGYRSSYDSIDVYVEMGQGKEMQFRNFGAETSGGWQGEISGAAAAQGKMGGGDVWTILNRFGAGYTFNNQNIWRLADTHPGIMAGEIYSMLKKYLPNTLPIDPEQEKKVVGAITSGSVSDTPRSYRYSKRLGLQVIEALSNMDQSDADEAIKDIYLYASSQTKTSSVYWKLT